MQEFIEMGGYGAYVWSAFGLTFVVLAWNVHAARRHFNRARLQAKRRIQSQAGAGT